MSGLRRSITTRQGATVRLVDDVIQTHAALHPGRPGRRRRAGGRHLDCARRILGRARPGAGGPDQHDHATHHRGAGAGRARASSLPRHRGAGRSLPPRAAEATGRVRGIEVLNVVSRSPAAPAGVRAGDVVVGIDDQAVGSVGALQSRLTGREPAAITLQVVRAGIPEWVTVTRPCSRAETAVVDGRRPAEGLVAGAVTVPGGQPRGRHGSAAGRRQPAAGHPPRPPAPAGQVAWAGMMAWREDSVAWTAASAWWTGAAAESGSVAAASVASTRPA